MQDETSCPDEDDFARLLEGLLPEEQALAVERHLDGCRACSDLVAELGKIYAPGVAPTSAPPSVAGYGAPNASVAAQTPSVGASARRLILLEALSALIHACAALRVATLDEQAAWLERLSMGRTAALIAAAVGWNLGCLALATASAVGLSRSRGWGFSVARWHALAALPTLVAAPLAWLALSELRGGAWRSSGLS